MGRYAYLEDLVCRLGRETLLALSDDDGDGAPDAAAQKALDQAEAVVRALLPGAVEPDDDNRDLLNWLCVSLAVPLLFARRREGLPDDHALMRASALEFVQRLASGEAVLPGATCHTLPSSTTLKRRKIFSRRGTSGF
mgnify:CR=1 FL=1